MAQGKLSPPVMSRCGTLLEHVYWREAGWRMYAARTPVPTKPLLTKQSERATTLRWLIALRMLISLSRLSSSLEVSFWRETALIATGTRDFFI